MSEQAGSKTTRTRIRLKHSLSADEEIHTTLPDSLEMFEDALARGDLEELAQLLNVRSASTNASRSASSL